MFLSLQQTTMQVCCLSDTEVVVCCEVVIYFSSCGLDVQSDALAICRQLVIIRPPLVLFNVVDNAYVLRAYQFNAGTVINTEGGGMVFKRKTIVFGR